MKETPTAQPADALQRQSEPGRPSPRVLNPVQSGNVGAEIKHLLPPLKALTSLRFFAAIYVVLFHLVYHLGVVTVPVLGNFISSGNSGVPFFFILSGFILAYNYPRVDRPRDFWISRFARIYPIYLVALLFQVFILFLPASHFPNHTWLRWILGATLLHAWYRPLADTFNLPGWTLSVEALFYAVFPFVIPLMKRMKGPAFVLFCAGYTAILCLPFWAYPAGNKEQVYYLEGGSLPLLYLPMFLIGVYLGVRYLKPGSYRSPWPLITGSLVSAVLLCLGPGELYVPLKKGLIVLSYAALIYGLASVRRGLLTNRWMVLAGEISFSIYILQMPVFRLTRAIARRMDLGPYETVALTLPVLIGISYLAYRFIELPARVAIRARLTRQPVPLYKL